MWIERVLPILLLGLCIVAAFFALGLLNIWQSLHGGVHILGLLGFASALVALFWYGRDNFRAVDVQEAARRVEQRSGFSHRLFRSLDDQQETNRHDPAAQLLWNHEKQRRIRALELARTGGPGWLLHLRDKWALRVPALLLLVTGLFFAGQDRLARLGESFVPQFDVAETGPTARYDLWVNPPDYVATAPFLVEAPTLLANDAQPDAVLEQATSPVDVPETSALMAQIHHQTDTEGWKLVLGAQEVAFEKIGTASSQAELTASDTSADLLQVVDANGDAQHSWPLSMIADMAPSVSWKADVTMTQQKSLNVIYTASDDHGLAKVHLHVSGPVNSDDPGLSEHLLREPRRQPKAIDTSGFVNLLTHPLAGLPVQLSLVAEDAAGNQGVSEQVAVILPEREFSHPLAREIIKQRKELASDPIRKRGKVASAIGALSRNQMVLGEHPVVLLSLRASSERLARNRSEQAVPEVLQMLWETAIYLEDGQLGAAEERLRTAQENLEEALERGADQEELDQLMAELQQAMQEYFEELAKAMQDAGEPQRAESPTPDQNSESVSSEDLMEMLQQAQELMQTGQIEQAQQMLAQLREMMENLQRPDGQQQQAQENPAEEALRGLQDVIREQRQLLDETFQMQRQQEDLQREMQRSGNRQSDPFARPQDQQNGQMSPEMQQRLQELQQQMQNAQQQQENIRRQLGETMMQLGEMGMPIPDELGNAELQMREAGEQLGEGQPGGAVPAETEALQSLQQGGNQIMEQMAQQPGQGQPGQQQGQGQPNGEGDPMQSQRGNQPDSRDPLGRSAINQGSTNDQGIKVPDQLDMGRAREVLDELRDRASDRTRPARELNYIDRLLERF